MSAKGTSQHAHEKQTLNKRMIYILTVGGLVGFGVVGSDVGSGVDLEVGSGVLLPPPEALGAGVLVLDLSLLDFDVFVAFDALLAFPVREYVSGPFCFSPNSLVV